MQRRLSSILLSCVLLALFALASEARADSIVISNGHLMFDNNNINTGFSLEGAGFSMQGHTSAFFIEPLLVPPGGTYRIGRGYSNEPLFIHVPYTINGVTYTRWGSSQEFLFLNFTASSFVLPLDTSLRSVSFTTPFTMNGLVSLSDLTTPNGLRVDLTGQGIANVVFNAGPGNVWTLSTLTYTFNQPPTPTPEPATLLLLGTGMAGVAAKVYRRRKERR